MTIRTYLATGLLDTATSVTFNTPTYEVGTLLTSSETSLKAFFGPEAFIDRKTVEFSVKEPKVSSTAPNGYTQARRKVLIKEPLALDNGNYTTNTVSIEFSVDVETTDLEITDMVNHCIGLLKEMRTGNDLAPFIEDGSLE